MTINRWQCIERTLAICSCSGECMPSELSSMFWTKHTRPTIYLNLLKVQVTISLLTLGCRGYAHSSSCGLAALECVCCCIASKPRLHAIYTLACSSSNLIHKRCSFDIGLGTFQDQLNGQGLFMVGNVLLKKQRERGWRDKDNNYS